jgi:hypothetical protein
MADSPKLPGRVVGRSTTGTSSHGKPVRLTDTIDRGYLCSKICSCASGSALISKSGQVLKQRCVTTRIWVDEEINQLVWRYKAEVGYSMKANPPAPLMSDKQPNRPSRFPLGAAQKQGVLKRGLESGSQKGLLKIPDCIVLKVTGPELAAMRAAGKIDWSRLIPVRANMEAVVEIKFPDDDLDREQEEAYMKIAGDGRFRLLELSDCDCDRKREQPATAPVRVPVVTAMPSFESRRLFQSQPIPFPAPQPVRPQYGSVVEPSQSTALSSFLKAALVTAGVILVGAIVIAALPAETVVLGVSLAVVGGAANAKSNSNKGR